ncbi:MAG TPA: hypothetical protein V6D43_07170 [Candidatus Sericytochromatia bacterium]|jgi:hypothetical protein
MNFYLEQTKYAASNLIDLIMHDLRKLEEVKSSLEGFQALLRTLSQDFSTADNSEDFDMYQIQHKYITLRRAEENTISERIKLREELEELKQSATAKSEAISSLCGALLQISKQGISIVHRSLDICPSGRHIGQETLKNIVWQGRNQSMHYEEGSYNSNVLKCFRNLELSFGEDFSLTFHSQENLAQKVVIQLLEWTDYSQYEKDMTDLLGNV